MTRCSGSFPATLGLTRNSFQVRMLFKKLTASYRHLLKEHRKVFRVQGVQVNLTRDSSALETVHSKVATLHLSTHDSCPNPANPYNTVVGVLPEKWLRKSCCCNRKEHQTHELRNVRETVILSAFTLQLLLVAGETTMSGKE